ncbi:polysaccharide lyase 6 family protein [uncultured Duncaniella sp.]|uniref:polysaccharide lyase 6 family protein n=3 Tax=uncultured Duncaniella sp. TaxID=2768039 RepID=UPI00261EB71F|nr:polysaccharide lyase 6 family protein [uncultured Duncaniella sp.]
MNKLSLSTVAILLAMTMAFGAHAKDYYFSPSEAGQMKALLKSESLKPGDNVILRDGIYDSIGRVDIVAKGTADDTISIRPEHPGKVVFTGPLHFSLFGEYIKLDGLYFNKAWALGGEMIGFRKSKTEMASNCRMTNCVIDDCNNPEMSESGKLIDGKKPAAEYWIKIYGQNNRLDHCYLANKRVGGLVLQVEFNDDLHINNHIIDHNVFGNRNPYYGNGAEIIRIGHSWSSQLESRTIVEDNVFLHCDGENEIISVKSCHNVLRGNLFFESSGGLVCRHGHYNVIENNTFIGNNKRGTSGIRIINQGHTVYDNFMARLDDFSLLVRMGVFERPTAQTDIKAEPLTSYHRVENVDFSYNHFVDCPKIILCSGRGDKSPRNVRFANNNIVGATNNIMFHDPDKNLKGFFFINNKYNFKDNSVIPFKGFDGTDHFDEAWGEIEKERVVRLLDKVGVPSYSPSQRDMEYILKGYL